MQIDSVAIILHSLRVWSVEDYATFIHYVYVAISAIVSELPEGNMLEDAGFGLSCKSEVYK